MSGSQAIMVGEVTYEEVDVDNVKTNYFRISSALRSASMLSIPYPPALATMMTHSAKYVAHLLRPAAMITPVESPSRIAWLPARRIAS